MANDGNIYSDAYENLYQYEEELKECFQRRADQRGQINSEDIVDLIDDISVIFAFDCERSKFFFSQENRSIPKQYNLNALKFNEFMDLFGLWLLKEAESFGQDSDRPRSNSESQIGQRFSTYEGDTVQEPGEQSPNYEENKKVWDQLVKKHKKEYREMFNDRLFEEGQIQISMQDFFVVLQEWFYIDTVDLKERADAPADFFMSVGSYKTLLDIGERFFLEEKGADPNELEIKEAKISFEECLAFMDYWLRTDPDVVLVGHQEENNDNNEEGGVKKVLEETIAKYEKMINDTSNPIEKEVLKGTVETLKKKLNELDKGAKGERGSAKVDDQQKREERKNRALKEIFDFYCTQQLNTGKSATFAKLDRLASTITLGTFKVFLKIFKLKLDHFKLIELYNKAAGKDDNLTFDEFKELLHKVALRADFAPEEKVHQPNPEIMKDYKPTSYKNDPTYKIFKQNEARKKEEAQTTKKKANLPYKDKTKRDEDRLEEVWEHMGLFDGRYKSIIGFFNLPFGSQDKQDFRIPVGSIKYKYKDPMMEGKSPQEIQEEVVKRNELRKLVKNLKSMEKDVLTNFRGSTSPVRPNVNKDTDETYVQKRSNKNKQSMNIPKKLTMKKVENLQQKEVKTVDDRFNPYDLIDDNDDDDNMYLAEYNIQNEKHQMRTQNEIDRRKAEEYGKLKKAAKGFAVNGRYGSGKHEGAVNRSYSNDVNGYSPVHNMGYAHANSRPYMAPHQPYQGGPAPYESPRNGPYSGRNKGLPLGYQPSYLEYDAMSYNTRSPTNNSGYGSPSNSYMGGHSGYAGYGGYQGPNEAYVRNNNAYGSKSPVYSAIERAGQIEMDSRKREQQMINNIMSIQNNQLKKGLKIAGK